MTKNNSNTLELWHKMAVIDNTLRIHYVEIVNKIPGLLITKTTIVMDALREEQQLNIAEK